jgi:protein-L-isoaspartate(D-aspartate) O-methyltransferase
MVARMCELSCLSGSERVLEVGAGSGYQTAVLCELARSIYGVEVRPELARSCQRRLAILSYRNVEIGCFDGTHGWRERAPYDVIIVAAGAPQIPPLLVDQLADGGRLVVPVGSRQQQRLAVVTRHGARFDVDWNTPCTFVDLVGKFGWGGAGAPKA